MTKNKHQEGRMFPGIKSCRQYFLTAFLIIIFLSYAAGSARSARDDNQKHFLWSAKGKNNTVYLLGAIHLLKKESYPLPAVLENIYGCCKTLVFETDLDGMNDPDLQAKIVKLRMYPAGQNLKKNISPETYALLKKKMRDIGLSIAKFEGFKPWFIAQSLVSIENQRLGFDQNLGIDRYFYNKVRKGSKQTVFFETNEYQIRLFANMGRRQQEGFLKETLQELETIEDMTSDMLDAWKKGDAEKLISIIKISFRENSDIYKRLFTQRNKRWMNKIQRLIRERGDLLVIVGAGHLVGKGSLIDLLEKKGYQINQM